MNYMKKRLLIFLIISSSFCRLYASESVGIISASAYTSKLLNTNNNFSLSTSSPLIFWNTVSPYNVTITDTELYGFLWGPMLGYINLNCSNTSSCASSNFKVSNNDGVLTGYAWGENAGWISFSCANVESNNCASNNYASTSINIFGELNGYAWSQNFGWIQFDCSNVDTCVTTDWRKPSLRVSPAPTTPPLVSTGVSSGGGYTSKILEVINYIAPITLQKTVIVEKTNLLNKKINPELIAEKNLNQNKIVTFEKKTTLISKKLINSSTITNDLLCLGATCVGDSLHVVPIAFLTPNIQPTEETSFTSTSNTSKKSLIATPFSSISINENSLQSITEKKYFLSKVDSTTKRFGPHTFYFFTPHEVARQKTTVKTSLLEENKVEQKKNFLQTILINFFHKTVNK